MRDQKPIKAYRCQTRIDDRGDLRLSHLPFRPGAEVEVIILAPGDDEPSEKPSPPREASPHYDLDLLLDLPYGPDEAEASSAEELLQEAEEDDEPAIPERRQSKESVDRWLRVLGKALAKSLGDQRPPGSGEGSPQTAETPAGGAAPGDEEELREDLRVTVDKMLKSLGPRAEMVVRMRFGIGAIKEHTVRQVAGSFAVTPSRIRQIQSRALRQLSHKLHPVEVQNLLHKLTELPDISSG